MALSVDTLVRCGVPRGKARAYLPLLAQAMREFDITTPIRARYFLAQIMHESNSLQWFEERSSGQQYEGNRILGNTHPGDGRRFKGRGPIQITGRWNYTYFAKKLGVNLVAHPQRAADPRVGFRI